MEYIIELEDIELKDKKEAILHKAKGASTLFFDDYGIEHILKPIDKSSVFEDGYKQGAEDMYEVINEITDLSYAQETEIFSCDPETLPPLEIIHQWKVYKANENKTLNIGDEVMNVHSSEKGIICFFNQTTIALFAKDSHAPFRFLEIKDFDNNWVKTRKHFDFITQYLKGE